MLSKLKFLYYYLRGGEKYARFLGVNLGKRCLISTRNWSSEPYLITIGDNVQITKDVYFHTHGGCHVARDLCPDFDVFGKILIKDNAYIGSGSHIMPGVTIGKNALVAAGSIVCNSVPDRQLWGGVPAKFICSVEDFYTRNKQYNTHTFCISSKDKKEILIHLPDNKFIKK